MTSLPAAGVGARGGRGRLSSSSSGLGQGAVMSARHPWEDDALHLAPALPEQRQDTGSRLAERGSLRHVGRVELRPRGRRLPVGGPSWAKGTGVGKPGGVFAQLRGENQRRASYAEWGR